LIAIIDEERIIDCCVLAIISDLCNDCNLPEDAALKYIFQKFPLSHTCGGGVLQSAATQKKVET
jgi:hypothetical protein